MGARVTVARRMRKYRAKKALRRSIDRAGRLGVDVLEVVANYLGLSETDRLAIMREELGRHLVLELNAGASERGRWLSVTPIAVTGERR